MDSPALLAQEHRIHTVTMDTVFLYPRFTVYQPT